MAYSFRHPSVVVTVDSGFVPTGRFAVRGKVTYSPKLRSGCRGRAEAAALLAMMAGLARESEHGLARGVRRGAVSVDGDRDLVGVVRKLTERQAPRGAPRTADAPAWAVG